jgi:hypothetical protein
VQVADSSGTTARQTFTLSVSPPGLPQVNITGVPDSPQPAQQITFNIALTSGYSLDITGQITLSFQPDTVAWEVILRIPGAKSPCNSQSDRV